MKKITDYFICIEKSIRQSLIYNLSISLLLIMGILYILFKIAPHTGAVTFSGNGDEVLLGSTADNIFLKVYNVDTGYSDGEEIYVRGEIYLNEYNILYDNQSYNYDSNLGSQFKLRGKYWIYINNEEDLSTNEEIDDEVQNVWERGVNNSIYSKGIILDTSIHSSRREDRIQILDHLSENEFDPDLFNRASNSDKDTTIKYFSSQSDGFYTIAIEGESINCSGPELRVRPLSQDCYFDTGEEKIYITEDIILQPCSSAHNSRGEFRTNYFHLRGEKTSNYIISLNSLNALYAKASGNLEFNYGNAPVSYNLNRRVMRLYSEKREINMLSISHQSENKTIVSGDVSEALLSDLDLFPSFNSWYRNNVLLIPLTLITTIFAGVALMQSSRTVKDKEKDNRSDDGEKPTIVVTVETQTPAIILEGNQAKIICDTGRTVKKKNGESNLK